MRHTRLLSSCVALALLLLLFACATDTPNPAEDIDLEPLAAPAFTSILVAKHSGKCLSIKGNSASNGAAAEQRACAEGEAFDFEFVPVSGEADTYMIVNENSGKCLDVFRAKTERGTELVQYRCGEGDNQHFKLIKATGDYYQLEVQHSEQCVDVFRARTADGTKVTQYTCSTEPERTRQGNQVWKISRDDSQPRARYSLRGDPDFDTELSQLSNEQRLWYKRLWAAIDNPRQYRNAADMAKSDNLYDYGRDLFRHNHALLTAFRVTGDLRLLDEVDKVAQLMRGQLSNGWCEGEDKDDYLNWRYRYDDKNNTRFFCKDTIELEETLTHGHVAMVAYALHVNRDLRSPSGADYGAHADFWLGYLRNHFEAKWRERSGKAFPDMRFLEKNHTHSYTRMIQYFYYVGKILEDKGNPDASYYLAQARKMTTQMFTEPYRDQGGNKQAGGFVEVDTPLGPAYVYAFGTVYADDTYKANMQATPIVYARSSIATMLDLHLEGFDRWAQRGVMERLATGFAHFVMDTPDIDDAPLNKEGKKDAFAKDVTGGKGAGGIPATTYRGRMDVDQYALSSIAFVAPWNASGKVLDINQQVYNDNKVVWDKDNPRRVHIPASMFLYFSYKSR